ncbi:hypothetical protein DM01DRAFT_1378998 [Hesseltinella vesiculosa]|uniref:CCHC-type domain-containing protein n=1 Tax=Hesseltinella vesiculosa TaxID=101127 RepID=A0A1X2G2D5_9FUNG|nr:hypothetical protein DM01DRAFT_1378998 [Hesseltinella vesiculosa]
MYLTQWDVTAPVRYRGAPRPCFHCRRTDHRVKDCPKWAEVICYRCKGHGHIKRFCRAKLLNKNEHKHEATTLATDTSDATADPSQLPKNPTLEMDNITGTTEPLEESPDNTQTDSDVDMDPEHADSMTTITTEDEPMLDSVTGTPDEDEDTIVTVRLKDRTSTGNGNAGTAASKHATYAIGTSMKTDTMEEMTEHQEETIASPSVRNLRARILRTNTDTGTINRGRHPQTKSMSRQPSLRIATLNARSLLTIHNRTTKSEFLKYIINRQKHHVDILCLQDVQNPLARQAHLSHENEQRLQSLLQGRSC